LMQTFGIKQKDQMALLNNLKIKLDVDSDSDTIKVSNVTFSANNILNLTSNATIKNFKNPTFNGDVQVKTDNIATLMSQAGLKMAIGKNLNNVALSVKSNFKGTKNSLTANKIEVQNGKNTVNANIDVKSFSPLLASGNTNIQISDISQIVQQLNIDALNKFSPSLFKNMGLKFEFKVAKNNASIKSLEFRQDKNLVNANVDIPSFSPLSANGNADIQISDISQIIKPFKISALEKASPALFQNTNLKLNFNATKEHANLNNIVLNHDENLVSANVNLSSLSPIKMNGNFNAQKINANKIMAQLGMEQIDITNKALLNNINTSANFIGTTNSMKLSNLIVKTQDVTAAGTVNVTSFSPLSVEQNVTVDHFDLSNISNIEGFKVPLTKIHANGQINMGNNGLHTISGNQNVSFGNVSILGVSLKDQIDYANKEIADLNKQGANAYNPALINDKVNQIKAHLNNIMKPGAKNMSLRTNLGTLTLNTTLNHGVASPAKFNLSGPDIKAWGDGNINLPKKSLNYNVSSKLVTPGVNQIFQHLTFSSKINGTFKDPHMAMDWNSLSTQVVNYLLRQGLEQVKQQAQEQIKQNVTNEAKKAVGNALQNLFH
jgi:hypothetical protein